MEKVSAVILAGGRASRMGGIDKGLITFRGVQVAASIAKQLEAQCANVAINANRNINQYQQLGYPVVEDHLEGFQGPLAGMLAGLGYINTAWMITTPCDGPFIADDYVNRMMQACDDQNCLLGVASCNGRLQPVYALVSTTLIGSLESFLQGDERKIDRWFHQHQFTEVDFSDYPQMFDNFNTPEQFQQME